MNLRNRKESKNQNKITKKIDIQKTKSIKPSSSSIIKI